ncbi:MAG: excinuclease ABC subunit UvrC [Prevotellaceae bacterium]|jgi:excinuclease ABC subunit C|nr:excinuclease ABC subunit UvrC [Prevotellaceae bacterium]
MKKNERLQNEIEALPNKPGVYQYFNVNDEIIYIGKAKNLKKRVYSYFNKHHDYEKINVLVRNIDHLKYIIVDTEADALLLENNLIKQHQPRYNAMLKDGKSYPSICITKEAFPRVFKTRSIIKNGSQYFGPYGLAQTVNSLINIIHQIYPIRTCRLPLIKEKIDAGKFRVCLQYHIHRCNGPCEGKESMEDYQEYIKAVRKILRGDANEISKSLYSKMQALAAEYKFEEAQVLKEKYELFEAYKSKSVISNTILENTDVFAYEEDEQSAYVNILRTSKGSIIQGFTIEYKKRLNKDKTDILVMAILELRERLKSDSKEIIVPFEIEFPIDGIKVNIPQRGDRKKLLDLATQNVKQYKVDRLKQAEKLNPDQRAVSILREIQDKLHLEKLPMTIEAFDNSNISGSSAVAACVVFKKGKPSKIDYRKYNIKTVKGPDDYASMKEVVGRRYSRMVAENAPLPDLIITDGGKGQMEVVRQVVEDELKLNIPIAGLAKNDKHRTSELLFGFPPKEIGLKPTEPLFKLLAQIQEEVHRFAIKFHRDKRSKKQIASELDSIKGIGEQTKKDLIKHFKSIKRIKSANPDELINLIGTNRASIIYNHFRGDLKP